MSGRLTASDSGRRTAARPFMVKLTAPSIRGMRTVRYWLFAAMWNLLGSPAASQRVHSSAILASVAASSYPVTVGSSANVRISSGWLAAQ